MLKQRVLTALVLIPLVLFIIYGAPSYLFIGFVITLLLGCGYEWSALIPCKSVIVKIVFLVALVLMLWINQYMFQYTLSIGLFIWVGVFLAIVFFPISKIIWGHSPVITGVGLLLLPLFAQSMISIYQHEQGSNYVLYVFLLVWAVDTGAYFAGKQWGRHKLIPAVSPGKTIEGVIGGVLLSMVVAGGGYYYFHPTAWKLWFCLAILTAFISIVGDLLISMLKRRSNVKDTGYILPGHGGVLDRLDSVIAAFPFFYWGLANLT